MKRVLVVSPHFPPDTGAASHRMRLLAPRLPEHGWEPTIVAIDSRDLGGRTEPGLEDFVHGPVRVERVRAWGGNRGRFLGIGDLGLRAFRCTQLRCRELLRLENYDALLITLPPHYMALVGPKLATAADVPYVLDYQDPWVSAWGVTVGGGVGGTPDWKSRLSHRLARLLEPYAVRRSSGLVAVSEGTLTGVFQRHPELRDLPRAEIPLGGDSRDFLLAQQNRHPNPFFDSGDGLVHLVYVGTLLPLGKSVLRTFFEGVALFRDRNAQSFARLRIHFYGTSNQTAGEAGPQALPIAQALGLGDVVDEKPLRIDYIHALVVQSQAAGILLLGSSEPHYTASKIYPALLAGRPLLALYHEASTACDAIRRHGPQGWAHLVTFGDAGGPTTIREGVAHALAAIADGQSPPPNLQPPLELGDWSPTALAGRLAACLSAAVARHKGRSSSHG